MKGERAFWYANECADRFSGLHEEKLEDEFISSPLLDRTPQASQALVVGEVLPACIYSPFLRILTFWVRPQHALVALRRTGDAQGPKVRHYRQLKWFNCRHVLSFVALAGFFVSSSAGHLDRLVPQGNVSASIREALTDGRDLRCEERALQIVAANSSAHDDRAVRYVAQCEWGECLAATKRVF